MTAGTAAGMIIRDLILDRENQWAELFRPSRFNLGASIGELFSHSKDAMGQLASTFLSRPTSFESVPLEPGEAGIFDIENENVAVYRDEDGEFHAVSATCTHMGCQVSWNEAERSWDCACHGSRFDIDGTVLDTPSIEDLQQYQLL